MNKLMSDIMNECKSSFNSIGSVNEWVRVALSNGTHVSSSFDFEISSSSP